VSKCKGLFKEDTAVNPGGKTFIKPLHEKTNKTDGRLYKLKLI